MGGSWERRAEGQGGCRGCSAGRAGLGLSGDFCGVCAGGTFLRPSGAARGGCGSGRRWLCDPTVEGEEWELPPGSWGWFLSQEGLCRAIPGAGHTLGLIPVTGRAVLCHPWGCAIPRAGHTLGLCHPWGWAHTGAGFCHRQDCAVPPQSRATPRAVPAQIPRPAAEHPLGAGHGWQRIPCSPGPCPPHRRGAQGAVPGQGSCGHVTIGTSGLVTSEHDGRTGGRGSARLYGGAEAVRMQAQISVAMMSSYGTSAPGISSSMGSLPSSPAASCCSIFSRLWFLLYMCR